MIELAFLLAMDWRETQDSRDFDAYRWEEQRRWVIEQDREERRDYRVRS